MRRYLNRSPLLAAALLGGLNLAVAQDSSDAHASDPFRQLEELLPTANGYRNAAGAPGHEYWQQQVDHDIRIALDDATQRMTGAETVTYKNNSPDALDYLWFQLDNNNLGPASGSVLAGAAPNMKSMSYTGLRRLLARRTFDGSLDVTQVADGAGNALHHVVVDTMLRVDLPDPLAPGAATVVKIDWNYQMNRSDEVGGRTAAEYFEEDGNWIYEVAHWFPRAAAYTDVHGWHNKQFLGSGEFTLEFGNYRVAITVPADHIVASTGVLVNAEDVLTDAQRQRLAEAMDAPEPMFIVTPDEALENQAEGTDETATWIFEAENVRDFAWSSSRKFIWDAWGYRIEGVEEPILAMSYYPIEGEPLWSRYSTQAIAHTLDIYSKFTFPYPYPVAISVNGPVGGMEYPMICFNGPRPEEDGTYTKRTKYGLIGVIIHEVGHNWFPMIVNSDERQWTWMDEGLNTFVQYLTEQEWEEDYPSRRGEPANMATYMSSENQVPIMTNSESILQFGNNAYGKPATALNVLRETVMGRELFDFAFKTYSRRWMFKRPMPGDLFRTMEDASAIDLDWFWRGWFYTTNHVDIAVAGMEHFQLEPLDPTEGANLAISERDERTDTLGTIRNASIPKRSDRFPELLDFYNVFDALEATPADIRAFDKKLEKLEPEERALHATSFHYYVIDLENLGGLLTPIPLELRYADGTTEKVVFPAELWRRSPEAVSKLIVSEREIDSVLFDPNRETADADVTNNEYPPVVVNSRFKLFDSPKSKNPMQRAREEEERAAKEAAGETVEDDEELEPVGSNR